MRKPILAAVAAVSMIGASSGALAQSAAPLSLDPAVRAGAGMKDANAYRGGIIIPTLVIVALGALLYVLLKNDNPKSP